MAPNPVVLVLFGILVGVFCGVMGLGGGQRHDPVMVLALAHDPAASPRHKPRRHDPAGHAARRHRVLPQRASVNLTVAGWMALGVLLGHLLWRMDRERVCPRKTLKLVFGFVLIYVAAYTVFGKEHLVRTLSLSRRTGRCRGAVYVATRWFDAQATPGSEQLSRQTPACALNSKFGFRLSTLTQLVNAYQVKPIPTA